MNAHELTIVVNKMTSELMEVQKEAKFLKQELEKIRLLVSDLQIDVKMMGGNNNG